MSNFFSALFALLLMVVVPYHVYEYLNGPAKPWYGYATNRTSGLLEPWWTAYETRRDCHQEMNRLVNSDPNRDYYMEPLGCTYMGNNYVVTFVINRLELGAGLQCVIRWINHQDGKIYAAKFAGYDDLNAGEGWYCM